MERMPETLRLLTWNCQGLPWLRRKERFQPLARRIQDLAPDVVFLQEIILADDLKYFRLEGYRAAYVRRGPLLAGGLLMLARVPLGTVRFSGFERQGAWHNLQLSDRALGKGYLEVDCPAWGVRLFNTHLVSTYQERRFREDAHQAAQLNQLLGRVEKCGPALLGGDFNFMDGTPYHRRAEGVLEDLSRGLHAEGLAGCQPKIDHLFAGALDWTESRCRFVPPGPAGAGAWTDHAGVFTEVLGVRAIRNEPLGELLEAYAG